MPHGWKLALGGLLLAGLTGYLAYLGAASSWQFYLHVDECVAGAERYAGHRVRINGKVVASSLQIAADRRTATFDLEGAEHRLRVSCRGPLPDNLAENMDVVVEGKLDEALHLRGEKVLTRCASKYESTEGAAASLAAEEMKERR